MVARIYRQMGRPYDASLIPEEEKHYLNGWDNGDDDDEEDINDPRKNLRPLKKWPPVEPFDPFKNVWKLDWGPEGSPANKPRTLEYRPKRDGTIFPGYGSVKNALNYRPGIADATTGVQTFAGAADGIEGAFGLPDLIGIRYFLYFLVCRRRK